MRHTVPSLPRRGLAFLLAVVLALPTVYASAGEQKLQTSIDVVDGLTWRNTVTVSGGSRVESFALELTPDSAAEPILLQGSGSIYGGGTIKKAVSTAQELGYHVLGAVNTDFFSMATGVPIGIVIEDGVYRSSPEEEAAMVITGGLISLCEDPTVALTLTNGRTGTATAVHHLNKYRVASGGLYLYNRDFSDVSAHTSSEGWYVRLKAADPANAALPELTVNSTLALEVSEVGHTDEDLAIGENEYLFTANDASGYAEVLQSFQTGDQVTLATSCQDPVLAGAQWAGGVGDVMIRDGAVTDSSQWTYRSDGRNPRTAMGVKKDGTVVLYAVDGRQTDYSAGLSQVDLADELLSQGCRWAVNLDGGGSTALSVWLPGQSGVAVSNSPSQGSLRACATYLLLVTPEAGDGRPDRLAWQEDGLTVLAGSSVTLPQTVTLDSGLNLLAGKEPTDLSVTSQKGLGTVKNGVYTAGTMAGTDTLQLSSRRLGIKGEGQIHVVDSLTELTVTRDGDKQALTALRIKAGETAQLAVTGSYWGREALRDLGSVSWSVEGDVGSIDADGLFTAAGAGEAGTIRVAAGGLTREIAVTIPNVHNDVTEDHWAYDAVDYCYEQGIVSGISTTEYGRDLNISRGDFALMLYGALGRPAVSDPCTFNDVSPEDYYYAALAWAQSSGLVSGDGAGGYAPKDKVTREQAFTVLRQLLPLLGKDCPDAGLSVLEKFADRDEIASYAQGHTATLVAQGIVSGKGAGIDPKGNLTRAEMAVLLYKLMTFTPLEDVPTDLAPQQPQEPQQPQQPQEPQEPQEPQQPQQPESSDSSGYILILSETEMELDSAGSRTLTAALLPVGLDGVTLRWTSSDPSAATVSQGGIVTNLSPRTSPVDVTVTASWNGLSASCIVHCLGARRVGTVQDTQVGLRIRSGPGTGYDAVGMLQDGAQAVVVGEKDGWVQILYRNSQDQAALGYVSGEYLTVTSQAG